MYYEEYGRDNSSVIVFLNAAGVTDSFDKLYDMSSKYRILVPHFYGIGEERKAEYTLDSTARGIAEIMQSIEAKNVTLVGFSLGAAVAVRLLQMIPDRISRVVLISGWFASKKIQRDILAAMASMGRQSPKDKLMMRRWYQQVVNLDKKTMDAKAIRECGIPIYAICGSKEIKGVKKGIECIQRLRPDSQTEIWEGMLHNIPDRMSDRLRSELMKFIKNTTERD